MFMSTARSILEAVGKKYDDFQKMPVPERGWNTRIVYTKDNKRDNGFESVAKYYYNNGQLVLKYFQSCNSWNPEGFPTTFALTKFESDGEAISYTILHDIWFAIKLHKLEALHKGRDPVELTYIAETRWVGDGRSMDSITLPKIPEENLVKVAWGEDGESLVKTDKGLSIEQSATKVGDMLAFAEMAEAQSSSYNRTAIFCRTPARDGWSERQVPSRESLKYSAVFTKAMQPTVL